MTGRIARGNMILVLLCMLAAIAMTGCDGKTSTGPEKIRIGYLVKMPEEPWFQHEWKFAQKCADQYGFDLVKIGAGDGEKVLSAIDNLAAQGAQGFVIVTPDVRLGPAIMAKANRSGMKVYSVDDQFVGPDGKFMDVPYMGIAARPIGEAVGKALYAEFKKRGWKIEETGACAITFDELDTVKQRTDGATEELVKAGFPADRIFRSAEKTTDVPGGFDATAVLLTQHPEIKRWLAFSVNDEGVLGAVRAMENRGFNKDTVIAIGIGGTTALAEFDKQEATGLYATLLINPLRHGFDSTENLYHWIKDGKEPPKDVRTMGTIITRQNARQVMGQLGLLED